MSFAEIKEAIVELTEEQRAELLALPETNGTQGDDAWDRQMEKDAKAGRLDWMFDDVDKAIAEGRVSEAL